MLRYFFNICLSPFKRKIRISSLPMESHCLVEEQSSRSENSGTGKNPQTFSLEELALATGNFSPDSIIHERSHFRVYKGILQENCQSLLVAVKQLDVNYSTKEFLVEVLTLSILHHQNLISLVGYCADASQMLLVYEFTPMGSLEDHLFGVGQYQKPLDWDARIKIAIGVARGLEYIHNKANSPVIHRDLTPSNILLDEDFNPKISNFGFAKLGSDNDKLCGSKRVAGISGYIAPEYARTGQVSVKSDVYSFGMVLLELMAGKRARDIHEMNEGKSLASWVQVMRRDLKGVAALADPLLQGNYPIIGIDRVASITAMCLQEEMAGRPSISDVVTALCSISDFNRTPHEASASSVTS